MNDCDGSVAAGMSQRQDAGMDQHDGVELHPSSLQPQQRRHQRRVPERHPSGSCRTDPRSAAYHLPTSPAWRQGQRRASVPAVQDAAARDYPAQRSDTSSGWMTFVRRLSTVATCTQRRRASLCPLPRFPFHVGAGKGDECFTVSLRDNREAHDLFLLLFEQAIGRQASTPERSAPAPAGQPGAVRRLTLRRCRTETSSGGSAAD